MFTYDCDYTLQEYRLTPITKRLPVRLAFLECIGAPVQWNRDLFFDKYIAGADYAAFNIGTSYARYDRVNYQNRIYECINDVTAQLPTNVSYWIQVLSDFRGAQERIKYNCQKLIMEYILNKWFGTTFNQPGGGNSIYWIETLNRNNGAFTIHSSGPDSIRVNRSFQIAFIKSSNVYSPFDFQVNYPVGITSDQYNEMTSLVEKYKLSGTTPKYVSY